MQLAAIRKTGHRGERGDFTDNLRVAIRAGSPAILAALSERHHRSWIMLRGRERFEVRILPERTTEEMHARYLGSEGWVAAGRCKPGASIGVARRPQKP